MTTDQEYDDKLDVMQWAPEAVRRYETATIAWRNEGEKIRRFKAGDQWVTEDKSIRTQMRVPSLVFNFFGNFVNALVGVQIRNRSYIHFADVGPEDRAISTILNQQAKATMSDEWEDEFSDAFEDTACTGQGAVFLTTTTRDGLCTSALERVPPFEIVRDIAAVQKNLKDRRWCGRRKRYSYREMVDTWGKAKADRCMAALAETSTRTAKTPDVDRELPFEPVHFQWQRLRRETRYRVFDPTTVAVVDLSADEFKLVESSLRDRRFIQVEDYENITPVYKQVTFCGDVKLDDESELPFGFTYVFMTGSRDHDENFYSPMRSGVDPQCFANMVFSTAVDDFMKSGKGLLAEDGAVDDMEEFARTYADASKVKRLAPGGLAKIKQMDGQPFSPALAYMFDVARSSISSILGINAETMGMVTAEQSNVLERTRQDASLTAFQSLFASERMARKELGRILLGFMTRYHSNEAFIRVSGPEAAPYLEKLRAVAVDRADIQIDQEPRTISQRQEALLSLQRLGEQMGGQAAPVLLPIVLKYLPIPPDDAAMIMQGMQPKPDPSVQAELQKTMAEVENLHAKTQEIMARIQAPPDQAGIMAPIVAERAKQETNAQSARFRALDDARAAELAMMNHQNSLVQAEHRDRLDAMKTVRAMINQHMTRNNAHE